MERERRTAPDWRQRPGALGRDNQECFGDEAPGLQDRTVCHPRLFTVRQALNLLAMGRTSFYARLNAGELRAVKVGRRTFVPEDELRAFVATLRRYQPGTGPPRD